MKTYPVNLVLKNKLVVLIGAGKEITRKIPGLLEVEARVRVIAPAATETIQRYAAAGKLAWLPRRYRPGDLAGAFLVIAATGDPVANDAIWAEGEANGQLVNVMDTISQCNFHAVSVMRQGQLTIAIGTGGAAPALSATLRHRFETEFGPEYARFLAYAQSLRPVVAAQILPAQRADFWYTLIDQHPIELLKAGRQEELEAIIASLLIDYKRNNGVGESVNNR